MQFFTKSSLKDLSLFQDNEAEAEFLWISVVTEIYYDIFHAFEESSNGLGFMLPVTRSRYTLQVVVKCKMYF